MKIYGVNVGKTALQPREKKLGIHKSRGLHGWNISPCKKALNKNKGGLYSFLQYGLKIQSDILNQCFLNGQRYIPSKIRHL